MMPSTQTKPETAVNIKDELSKCAASCLYFILTYVYIFSAKEQDWITFKLWPAQIKTVSDIVEYGWIVIIKSRQVGFTWMARAYFLWLCMFHPVVNIGMWSKSDSDAKELLSRSYGLMGMYQRLPEWMQVPVASENEHKVVFDNGSIVKALPYTQAEGSSYTHALIDEIDRFPFNTAETLVKNLKAALEHAKAVIWGSISDKERPNSLLKRTFVGAQKGEGKFRPVFIPWHASPYRDEEWYEEQYQQALVDQGDELRAKEYMQEQYPNSPEEAMAASSIAKRIPADAVARCSKFVPKLNVSDDEHEFLDLPGSEELHIYHLPEPGGEYVFGADPAGGDGGDEAVIQVLDSITGRHMATFASRYSEPVEQFPLDIYQIAVFYNHASGLIERNNHGIATIPSVDDLIMENDAGISLILGHDGKLGWLQTKGNKTYMWDRTANAIKAATVLKKVDKDTGLPMVITRVDIADPETADQIADIDKKTLNGVRGMDDRAVAYALAVLARELDAVYIEGDPMV